MQSSRMQFPFLCWIGLLLIYTSRLVEGSDLVFSPQKVELGNVDQGSFPLWIVVVKNNTRDTISHISISPQCVCTQVTAPKDSLQPGESMNVSGRIRTLGMGEKGPFNTAIEVEWETAGHSKNSIIPISGNLRILADVIPKIVDLGILTGETSNETLLDVIRGDSDKDWRDVAASAMFLNTKVQKINANHFIVRVTSNYNTLPIGSMHDVVYISLLDRDAKLVYKYGIGVMAKVKGNICASPDSLYAGVIDSPKEISFPFAIKSSNGEKLQFISVEVPNEFIKVTPTPSEGGSLKFRCVIDSDPAKKTGNITGIIKVHVKTETNVEVDIPCFAYVQANASSS
jgi:hypothetical protein